MIKNIIARMHEAMCVMPHLSFEVFVKMTELCDVFNFITFHTFAEDDMFVELFEENEGGGGGLVMLKEEK